jgi:NAD(P)-dependent dehydrogenase (short-subunit alcohol dehydrogenase family)
VRAEPVQADLSDPAAARLVADAALERFGRVDILVHSASPFVRGSLSEVKIGDWRGVMGVVVESLVVLAQGLTPGMVQRGEGAIVAILDRGVIDPWPGYLAHGVAKSALWALVRSLSVELAPNVRVNGILPGPILPPPDLSERRAERIAAGTLLGRWGGTESVVDAMLFLIRSDFITAEMLVVDGGERWAHRQSKSG